ncbi:MAG: prolyl oligopeptidase family serine peptidase [Pseudomonadales bacterium]|nr:prolyl oligopeptidase family serine peptidase [Pseudomonadales bacterium]
MKKISCQFVFSIVFCFSEPALSSEDTHFQIQRADGSSIDYSITHNSPKIAADVLLLIVQGSDCNSVLHKATIPQLKLAWPEAALLLNEKYGITAALPYSKDEERIDCPASYLQMDSLQQRASDILQVIEKLKAANSYPKLLMIGGSEGAVVANIVASRTQLIDASVSFNGGGRWFKDDVIHSIKYGQPDSPALQSQIDGFSEMAAQLTANAEMQMVISGHGSKWWRSTLQLDQLAILSEVKSSLLIVQADSDQAISVENTDKMIEELLQDGKVNIEYKKYPGLDHSFRSADGESQLAKVVAYINQWFTNKINLDAQ